MEPTRHTRRSLLTLLGVGAVGTVIAACGSSGSGSGAAPSSTVGSTPPTSGAGATDSTVSGGGSPTPSETSGPFPADGSNGNGEGQTADVLGDERALRSDIRSDLDGSNTQAGEELTLRVRLVDAAGNARAGHAVYVWHCNREGEYSGYNSRMSGGDFTDRSFLRGAQIADADGRVQFTTILPGRYMGRAFHIHFAVYSDGTYSNRLLTSQMALDDALVDQLYADAGYATALRNSTTNAGDNVFADGVQHQLLAISGAVGAGLTADFTVVV